MKHQFNFIHELPNNSKKIKLAFLNLSIILILCIVGYVLSVVFWEQFTEVSFSMRYQRNVTVGWPATLQGWSQIMGIGILICLPFMYFMQDWKNPSLAITNDSLFINQQMIRNTFVPFSNILKIEKIDKKYKIHFKNNADVVSKQVFIFKPFVKSNLENNNFFITDLYSSGDLEGFFKEVEKNITK